MDAFLALFRTMREFGRNLLTSEERQSNNLTSAFNTEIRNRCPTGGQLWSKLADERSREPPDTDKVETRPPASRARAQDHELCEHSRRLPRARARRTLNFGNFRDAVTANIREHSDLRLTRARTRARVTS